jgi:hypothetical protein
MQTGHHFNRVKHITNQPFVGRQGYFLQQRKCSDIFYVRQSGLFANINHF